jgi:hypothetical protein
MSEALVIKPEESLTLSKVGAGLFKSGLFPNARNEFGAYAIVQYGYELGVGPMTALKNINIIKGQLAANAQLMLSLAMSRGVVYEVQEETDKNCKIKFERGGIKYVASFDEKDAKAAGLLDKKNYPKDMYFWRAVAKGVRRVAPEAVMGLYTPDEISEGKYIDVRELSVESGPQKEEGSPMLSVDAAVKLRDMMVQMGHPKNTIIQLLSLRVKRELKKVTDLTEEEGKAIVAELEIEFASKEAPDADAT